MVVLDYLKLFQRFRFVMDFEILFRELFGHFCQEYQFSVYLRLHLIQRRSRMQIRLDREGNLAALGALGSSPLIEERR